MAAAIPATVLKLPPCLLQNDFEFLTVFLMVV
jgi:hypothetical protein